MIGSVTREIGGTEYSMRFSAGVVMALSEKGIKVMEWSGLFMQGEKAYQAMDLPVLSKMAVAGLKSAHPAVTPALILSFVDEKGLAWLLDWVGEALVLFTDPSKADGDAAPGE